MYTSGLNYCNCDTVSKSSNTSSSKSSKLSSLLTSTTDSLNCSFEKKLYCKSTNNY